MFCWIVFAFLLIVFTWCFRLLIWLIVVGIVDLDFNSFVDVLLIFGLGFVGVDFWILLIVCF